MGGGIAYKAFEPISENERCVWTIRAGIVKGFTLNVLNIGISNSTTDTQVIASCLRHQAGPTYFLLNQTGSVNGVGGCDVLVITLASGRDVGNSSGFVLEYSVLRNSTLSLESQDYIIKAEEAAIIRYPSPALEYTNFEFTTFTILPNLGSKTNVIYFRNSLEGTTCLDNLRIYRFNASSEVPTKWQYDGIICGQIPSNVIINDDLILITFNSDISRVGSGFELAVVTSAASECHMFRNLFKFIDNAVRKFSHFIFGRQIDSNSQKW
ncbi:hypothetical protein Ocin01_17480 [Orchesella cincta]|uniref:CUB domain-containing protein n=1 Tax=Orchesella cincta TaxID=48709 RepID=A0A1D2M8E4_ORCCI|nr:hypothetical protein Ocin01_17480 [Orchesella cincta]